MPVTRTGAGEGAAPFSRVILREQVRDLLLARILSGHYSPGSRLVETRIAQELGISQAPVREALRDLEQLGCVVHEAFRGCSVRELSIDDLLEAFPVRAALESVAARLAAHNISDDELALLDGFVATMRTAGDDGDAMAESAADAAFHATIVQAARNRVLARQWEQLQPHARTFISISLPASARGPVADRHLPILDALRARDPERAATAMHDHLSEVADRLRPLTTNKEIR
ncbi:MAG TPA: GntR family transcriptional regulator [Baekduia sp.]|uniref:GntR family transcriptional regulator n=1 Tax=Baekduia sp. TaxID=2600305 RepID=UPI002C57EDAC|nr:GntR family transcriptional regulator [Baekduia sp.]HMJ37693.1 GntR family transcriptional regulator [Baekduia sp.]